MAPQNQVSTTKKGNDFRDQVVRLLDSAGYTNIETEKNVNGKTIDIYAESETNFLTTRVGFEAKDYSGTLPIGQVTAFAGDYGSIRSQGAIDQGVLVSRGPISPDGVLHLGAAHVQGLVGMTYTAFQRRILGPDVYLRTVIDNYEKIGLQSYYIPARISEGALQKHVENWISAPSAKPLVVFGDYGNGKSTFALHFAVVMARRALSDPTSRIPILVPLGHLAQENSLDGLFGRLFTNTYRLEHYNWPLFLRLNHSGRFLIIFDGFDEMKHGMTFSMFQRQFDDLLSMAEGDARVLILGRDTAIGDGNEFKAIIEGRATTASGSSFKLNGHPSCAHVKIEEFTLGEAQDFVTRFFPVCVVKEGVLESEEWISARLGTLLSGQYDELLLKPVHGQMLCRIASDPEEDIAQLDEFGLYDRFVEHLLRREVEKPGRYSGFDVTIRRRANAGLSWWLLKQGGASTTTITDAPVDIFKNAVGEIAHEFDDTGLVRELYQGCLVEKGGGKIYFGHRSIQEFLAAEYLYDTGLSPSRSISGNEVKDVCAGATKVVVAFLDEVVQRRPNGHAWAKNVVERRKDHKGHLFIDQLGPFVVAYQHANLPAKAALESPFYFWLNWNMRFGNPSHSMSAAATQHLLSAFGHKKNRDLFLAAIVVMCLQAALKPRALRDEDAIASLIETAELSRIVEKARYSNRPVPVSSTDSLPSYLLALAVTVRSGRDRVRRAELNLSRLYEAACEFLGYRPEAQGPSFEELVGGRSVISATAQRIVNVLGLSTARADRIRPFFVTLPPEIGP